MDDNEEIGHGGANLPIFPLWALKWDIVLISIHHEREAIREDNKTLELEVGVLCRNRSDFSSSRPSKFQCQFNLEKREDL